MITHRKPEKQKFKEDLKPHYHRAQPHKGSSGAVATRRRTG
jgi:hypothetical protein